jgi:ADP-ribose pyrophosphatase YjhB (NUDIX family)/TolA-binding protein
MRGLLEKAGKLRQTLGKVDEAREELAFDPDSGITREEQREIRAEIEKVATSSRLAVDADTLAVKAAKRGVLFPVLVNLSAVVVLGVGLAVLYVLFQRGETAISRGDTVTITAEGKLLEEVKKESEARLQEKNQQINSIQGRLAEIDKQRQDLQANMDARVQAKETELRAALDAELAAEKARLEKQGLSDQDIQKKLADLETQKNAAFTKELDAFKVQADAERRTSEQTLQQLQTRYNADLARANAERQQVLADSRQREAELQAQLAAQTKEAQAAQAQTQQQLAALTSQKAQEDLVSQQLVGLYAVTQQKIAARDYAAALTSLQAISKYVDSADVVALPGMAKRRPVDLFIVDSLSTLVQDEMDKAKTDTTSLVDAANRIADIRARVADADTLLAAGRVADAEKQYSQALAVLPEIGRSYAFFTTRAANAEAARQTALNAALARAESAAAEGRSPDAIAAYRDALAYLPETGERIDQILTGIAANSASAAVQKTQGDQSRTTGPIIAAADDQLARGSYAEAGGSYARVLRDYPQSAQAPQALRGISLALDGLSAAAAADSKAQAARVDALNAQLASLQQSLARSVAEITGVKRSIMDLIGQTGDPEKTDTAQLMASLSASYGNLTRAGSASTDLQAQLDAAQKAAKESEQKVATLTEENRKLQEAAKAAPATPAGTALSDTDSQKLQKYNLLLESYQKYASLEGSPVSPTDLLKTYGYRESFLQSASGSLPGFADRIHNYDNGFLEAGVAQGRDDTLKRASTILVDLAKQKTADERKSFFEAQLAAAKGDRGLTDYLLKLQALLPAG